MKTVLITGCSSGFGLEIARYFLERDWSVIATMRKPDASVLAPSDRLRILALDVTDASSIAAAVDAAGPVDVLVNNAGVGAAAPFELTGVELARQLLETNTLGTMAVTQAFVAQFRARGTGTIVNVTSSVTLKALPLVSMYTASKAAVNAFSASLAVELAPFGIGVKIVLPGRSLETQFGSNAYRHGLESADYADLIQKTVEQMTDESGPMTHASDVAEAVWLAATDPTAPMRIPAGEDACEWMREASTNR
ncbi:SDR family oxidoreductase [Salinicola rhizosphaerae]|uniref:Short-chain dehydrogenase/reductase n=1 Tax=Salinicola rhizosphaerae TaxID=1443141 RepID=A0ABQ3DVI3_9GAMM|nr:SDR family oxidoreductase [Salinicola rhizosphaerae]GHB14756.1 short-chain dehydrogenase/reductase [Salinicola rhizosphaerae]